jgi:DNA-binding transcriptional ArsR family regulator
MSDGIDLEQKKREEARWRILRVIDAGRPIAVSEQIIWRVLLDIKLGLSLNAVRRELAYLRDHGLVELEGEAPRPGSVSSPATASTSSSTTSRRLPA